MSFQLNLISLDLSSFIDFCFYHCQVLGAMLMSFLARTSQQAAPREEKSSMKCRAFAYTNGPVTYGNVSRVHVLVECTESTCGFTSKSKVQRTA